VNVSVGKRTVRGERVIRDRHVRERRQMRVEGLHRSGLGFVWDREMFVCLRKGFRGWMCCGDGDLGVRRGLVLFAIADC
jgi:hypothetical protein